MWPFNKKKNNKSNLVFELIDNNDFKIFINLEKPLSDEHAASLTRAFANLLVYLQTGQITKPIQEAVNTAGKENDIKDITDAINKLTNYHVSNYHFLISKNKSEKKLTMLPEDVFNPKRYD